MIFPIDRRKAIEASAILLRLVRGRIMDWKRLLALLYIADRRSLAETGRPIIGGKLVAMKYGPIHSDVYDLLKGGHRHQPEWSKHFENPEPHRIHLVDDLAVSALSRYEVNLLNAISDELAALDTWDVAELTHLPEWKSSYVENTSTVIPLEKLIDAVGRADEKVAILQEAQDKDFFDKVFSG